MLGLQMREYVWGRDPLPMDSKEFWIQALLSSGGLGIYGDFIFNAVEDERTALGTWTGPVIGLGVDLINLAASGAADTFSWAVGSDEVMGGKWNGAEKAVRFAARYTPGSSIWWAKLVLARQVFDRAAEVADPKAYKKRKARAKRRKEKYGNESLVERGGPHS